MFRLVHKSFVMGVIPSRPAKYPDITQTWRDHEEIARINGLSFSCFSGDFANGRLLVS